MILHGLKFLKGFIQSPRDVGALAPSSKFLADCVTDGAGVRDAKVVVEWGPGTGAITEAILEKLAFDAVFFGMEINPDFVEMMRRRFPRVTVHQDSATNTRRYIERLGFTHCDSVVSGLPWTVFDEKLQDELLDALVDVLRPGGRFATYTYITSKVMPASRRFGRKIAEHFDCVETTPVVWRNLPPAYCYVAQK